MQEGIHLYQLSFKRITGKNWSITMPNKTNWQEGVKTLGLYSAINRNSFSSLRELQFDLSLVSI